MNTNQEEQEDELLALQSIFEPQEFVRDESKFAGEIRVSAELPSDFIVALKEGETLRQYEISFLPPLLLTFDLPADYPSSSPPSFSLTCSWMTHTEIAALSAQLVDLYQATGGAVVLFSWVQFLREDALKFLDIQSLLELPSDGHSTLQDKQTAPSSEEKSDPLTSSSEPADERRCDASDALKPDVSAPSTCTDSLQALTDQEDFLDEGDVSASDPVDPGAQGACVQDHTEDPPRDEDRALCDAFLSPSRALLSQILIHDAAQKQRVFDSSVFDCAVCFVARLGSDCVQLSECGHIFCQDCVGEFCRQQITEGNVRRVTCPQADCTATPTPAQVLSLVGEELFHRYDRLLLQTTLDCMSDVIYCPRPACAHAVIQEASSCAAMCPVCSFAFCVSCRKAYHGTEACRGRKTVTDADRHKGLPRLHDVAYCPQRSCGAAVVLRKLKLINNEAICPECNFSFCLTCRKAGHGTDDCQSVKGAKHRNAVEHLPESHKGMRALWDGYSSGTKHRKRLLEAKYGRKPLVLILEAGLSELWIASQSKSCPHCFCKIQKEGGCNTILCFRCKQLFCWKCLSRLEEGKSVISHFKPSGCPLFQ